MKEIIIITSYDFLYSSFCNWLAVNKNHEVLEPIFDPRESCCGACGGTLVSLAPLLPPEVLRATLELSNGFLERNG